MTSPSRVLVAVAAEATALRLRLLVEAEGGQVASLGDLAALGADGGMVLALASEGLAERVRMVLPGLPVHIVGEGGDWDGVRSRIAAALGHDGRPSTPAVDDLAGALAGARILLVDDSVTYREFLRLELTRQGSEVTACASADEGFAALGRQAWDGVLVDLVMPGMDGLEFCRQAARLRRDRGLRFVLAILSSREGKADLLRGLEAGADIFLGKSLDNTVFHAKLAALLRRRFLAR